MNGEQAIWVQGLRWLGVLPAAVVGCLVAFWIASLLNWLNSSPSDVGGPTWLHLIFKEVLGNGASGAGFVCAGALMAPKGRSVVAVVLCAVMLSLSVLSLFGVYLTQYYWPVIAAVSAGAGSIAAAVFVIQDQ
jgi:hypothetical protein